jgi:hypothetical protein
MDSNKIIKKNLVFADKFCMKNNTTSMKSQKINQGWFEPIKEAYKEKLFKNNKITENLPGEIKKLLNFKGELKPDDLSNLISFSKKPEDLLEICFYAERNPEINQELLWTSGLEKFNSSAIYLENLGYFFFQKHKYHKSLEYLSKSHAIEKSLFALSLAIAAAYAVTQYHLVIEYYNKIPEKDKVKLNEDLIVKVATSALYLENYDLSMKLFETIQNQKKVKPLPDLKKFLVNKFGSEEKIAAWKNKISETLAATGNHSEISLEEAITYASILIHEDNFNSALEYLLDVKKHKFNGI